MISTEYCRDGGLFLGGPPSLFLMPDSPFVSLPRSPALAGASTHGKTPPWDYCTKHPATETMIVEVSGSGTSVPTIC